MIIAIDGPAASGKGTLGKRLASHFGLRHLDTGLLYRAVAKALNDAGRYLEDRDSAVAAARSLDPAQFDEKALKGHAIGEAASIVSMIPEVRGWVPVDSKACPGQVIGIASFTNAFVFSPSTAARQRAQKARTSHYVHY